jgi:hypothetical protein
VFSEISSNEREASIYYAIVKGMVTIVSLFSLCGYYVSLTHIVMSLRNVYNAKQKLGNNYILYPLFFGLCCMLLATFIFEDTGIDDSLIDGITDGSQSELLQIPIIFIVVPYLSYSMYMLWTDRSLHKKKEDEVSEIMNLHINYCLFFILTIMPACLVELLPMLWKKADSLPVYSFLSGSTAALFACSGIGVSVFRMREYYARKSLKVLYNKIFNKSELGENLEVEEVKLDNFELISLLENKEEKEFTDVEDQAVQNVRVLIRQ